MARRVCLCGICENGNLPSVCAACINSRLMDKYKLLKRLSRHRDILRMQVEARLKAKHEVDQQHHWSIIHKDNISKLKERLQEFENELRKGKEELIDKQHDLDSQSHFLAVASAQLAKKQVEQLGQHQPDLVRTHSLRLTSFSSELHQRRRFVFRQLYKVFPLKPMSSSSVGGNREGLSASQFWTICGARLPVSDDPHSVPKQELGASLGYMLQLLHLAANYLSAPLLHNAHIRGSTSKIWQRSSYWDAHSSNSGEYPLFVPPQCGAHLEEQAFSDNGTSIMGFSTIEGTGEGRLEDGHSSSSRYGSSSLQTLEMHTEVHKGIKLLKRSVGCVSSYGFNQLLSSMSSSMTTFKVLAELMILLSSKEVRLRTSRSTQHQINSLAESALSTASTMEISRQERDSSVLDEWDMVEHPTLPPPPSHSEDVEHWTRAMFVDATK